MKLSALALIGSFVCAPALAAPVAPGEAESGDEPAAASAIGRATEVPRMGDGAGSSRSVDILIELQKKSAGLDFSERARESGNASRVATPPAGSASSGAEHPQSATRNAAGLFGSGAVPMAAPRETSTRESEWRPTTGMPSAAGEARSGAATEPVGGSGGGRWLLPREIVQWVRDNRAMVIGGAVVLLVLLWGTSVVFSQRRR